MGTFSVEIEIGDAAGERWETVEALVDTGASYTWLPRDLLERFGVEPRLSRDFRTADGRVVRRDMAQTEVRWDGEQVTTLVVFGDEGSRALLGAYTLEGFGVAADPLNGRLIRVEGLAMSLRR